MSANVLIEKIGHTLVITINRPAQRNAVNRAVSMAIADALDRLDSEDDLRVGILTGASGNFCSGMDLRAFVEGERPELEGRGFGGLTEAPPRKPLIAAVEGYALAGGCELALACDLIVAADDATFGLPEVCRGLVAGSGGLIRMARKVPPAIALEYALTGNRMAAPIAQQWGMINRLVPSGQALTEALALASEIAANAPLSVMMSKRIVEESGAWAPAEIWDCQRPLVDSVLASDDAQEGARAFTEKRDPVWSGR
ncbi:crotonase/enoyl-CoA hydratase family protein [Croceicoccus ponticola]|uniref:Crotonase/enoyl-CoA hydratase family protein n=1 Tax=Croceicoccus ponticola TaxID=2217664 RepID=A0A437GW80_9SPHN|nr:crotonase/enoyl-CoA hydratase family protein [Croceicoccus ponticola]RVQ65019.1 crotonase/enoyl-CoA hydratase family protein [Croceicoccus ponticola]